MLPGRERALDGLVAEHCWWVPPSGIWCLLWPNSSCLQLFSLWLCPEYQWQTVEGQPPKDPRACHHGDCLKGSNGLGDTGKFVIPYVFILVAQPWAHFCGIWQQSRISLLWECLWHSLFRSSEGWECFHWAQGKRWPRQCTLWYKSLSTWAMRRQTLQAWKCPEGWRGFGSLASHQ